MIINYFGTLSNYLSDAFFDANGNPVADVSGSTSTQILIHQPYSGITTTVAGSGFTFGGDGVTGGTITTITFSLGGTTIATFSGISWSAASFDAALRAIGNNGDFAPMGALFNSSGPVNIYAAGATEALSLDDLEHLAPYITNGVNVVGTVHWDTIRTTVGNDTIDPGDGVNYQGADIYGSTGNDVYNLGAYANPGWVGIYITTSQARSPSP